MSITFNEGKMYIGERVFNPKDVYDSLVSATSINDIKTILNVNDLTGQNLIDIGKFICAYQPPVEGSHSGGRRSGRKRSGRKRGRRSGKRTGRRIGRRTRR